MVVRNILRIIGSILRYPLLMIGKIVKRNKQIWVFGNSTGFVDNTKYLFEYLYKNHKEIKPIWLSTDNVEKDLVKKLGYVTFSKYSLRGIFFSFISGVGFVNNGFGDLNRYTIGGQILIYVGHGEPIKKLYLDSKRDWFIYGDSFISFLNKLSFFFFRKNQNLYEVILTSSDTNKKNLASAFGVKLNKITITGLPRTDIILRSNPKRIFNKKIGQIILYAPTFREMGWPQIKNSQFNNTKWNELLNETKSTLYIKAHHFTRELIQKEWKINTSSNIKYLNGDEYQDINYLLPEVDILITDYSSVCIDFALLERSILFFTPDLEKYKDERGFYYDFENEITGGLHCLSWDELYRGLEHCLLGDENRNMFIENAIKLKKMFHRYTDTNNCERIYNQIISTLK